MGTYLNDKGYYCYIKSGYQMSGENQIHVNQHHTDMEMIANDVCGQAIERLLNHLEYDIKQIIEDYGKQVWQDLIQNLISVIETDVQSQVKVGFDGLREVFYGDKCQKYISDAIMKTMLTKLNNIKLK